MVECKECETYAARSYSGIPVAVDREIFSVDKCGLGRKH
jgi:hypothetical protein